MSEQQERSEQELLSTQINPSVDWFLQLLVKIVNGKDDLAFPITLNVNGVMISGELVSGHRYFEGFAKDFKEGLFNADSEDGSGVEKNISQLGSIYKQSLQESEHDEEILPPNYIHLKNTRVFHPAGQPIPNNRGVWWRGRLNAVDGFILGRLSADVT